VVDLIKIKDNRQMVSVAALLWSHDDAYGVEMHERPSGSVTVAFLNKSGKITTLAEVKPDGSRLKTDMSVAPSPPNGGGERRYRCPECEEPTDKPGRCFNCRALSMQP
jgi:hypothetical protein